MVVHVIRDMHNLRPEYVHDHLRMYKLCTRRIRRAQCLAGSCARLYLLFASSLQGTIEINHPRSVSADTDRRASIV